MNSKFFYFIVLVLYLSAPYFMYEYSSFRPLAEDQTKAEAAIVTAGYGTSDDRRDEISRIDQEDQVLRLESYGYLGGSVFFVLCPTLMLMFRRKLVRL